MIYRSSVISGNLTWSKISHRYYELKLDSQVLGTLRRPNFWSSTCLADTQSGHWIFRRGGWFGAGLQILDPTSARKIATFTSVWGGGGGTLTFADGESFSLECDGWWRPVWQVASQTGETLLRLHPREKNVELAERAALVGTRLSLLILFACYRVLQGEEDALVAAIAAS